MASALPKLVLVPGLGADAGLYAPQRAYFGERLVIPPWIEPASHNESLDAYGRRLAEVVRRLPNVTPPYFVGGISFGGMVAAEIAEACGEDVAGLFLVGSCTRRDQVRWLIRAACLAGQYVPRGLVKGCLNHLIPTTIGFTEALSADGEDVMHDVWFRADTRLMQWAARGIRNWSSGAHPRCPTFVAHGRWDQIIPIKEDRLRPGVDLVVPDGRHLIHLTHRDVINRWMDARMRSVAAAL